MTKPTDLISVYERAEKAWIGTTVKSKEFARICSETALEHFAACGDVALIQRFFDAINTHGKNYVRKAGYVRWAVAFAPVLFGEDSKFSKDKDRAEKEGLNGENGAVKVDMVNARAKPFWDFSPEPEIKFYNETDVVICLEKALDRLGAKTMKAKDDAAVKRLADAKSFVAAFKEGKVQIAQDAAAVEAA